jgi:hypothetical protein
LSKQLTVNFFFTCAASYALSNMTMIILHLNMAMIILHLIDVWLFQSWWRTAVNVAPRIQMILSARYQI